MDAQSMLAGGGLTGLAGAIYLACKLVFDWLRDRHNGEITGKSASVTDAATANAVILKSLEALRIENDRLHRKVNHLDAENEQKDNKIAELETRLNQIAGELADRETRLNQIATELAELKSKP